MRTKPASARRAARPIALAALRGFESAARHLSFTVAATELNLTQSSISRQIASLERQVGKPLFVRRTRALELTAAGERLDHNAWLLDCLFYPEIARDYACFIVDNAEVITAI
ncbi:MAG: LysR family transcriptional regulator, partial [Burkholderiaceae bacterium]|nr:LysR family transcriptional regulator [Burkholderiaceae bacterium]